MKTSHGNFFIQSQSRNDFLTGRKSISSNQKLAVKMNQLVCKAFILKNSYFYRIVDEWNSLLLEVRSSCNVVKFKAGVIKFVTKL